MPLEDARFVLMELLDMDVLDSLIGVYYRRDILHQSIIELQIDEVRGWQAKSDNQIKQTENLNAILKNKDDEITLLNDTIKQQKKEIKKQKFLKIVGFISAVVLPIVVAALIVN